jgi:hypothetical protein
VTRSVPLDTTAVGPIRRPRLPVRFTVRSLMIAVLVAALGAAMVRVLSDVQSVFLLVVGVVDVVLAYACWMFFRGTRRMAQLCFVASAIATNSFVAAVSIYATNLVGFALMFLATVVAIPVISGSGAAWAVAATSRGAEKPRSAFWVWPIVVSLAVAPLTMFTSWPLWLAFLISRPDLDRLADRVATGQGLVWPQWAGLYRIVGAARDPRSGDIGLITDPNPAGRSGFVRLCPDRPANYFGPLFNFNFDIPMTGCWRYQDED